MHPVKRVPLSFLVLYSGLGLAFPQAPPPQASPQAIIRSSTQLVQITVIATGGKGVPIGDLTANDFTITEKGHARPIAAFENNSLLSTTKPSPSIPAYAPFSNRPLKDAHAPTVVLLLDTLDSDPLNWNLAWPQVIKFLRSLQPQQRIAVYSLDPVQGLQVLQDYDSGHDQLVAALRKSTISLGSLSSRLQPQARQYREPSFAKRESELTMPELLSFGHLFGLAAAFHVIGNHLANVPGPKSFIWLACEFPNPFREVDGRKHPALELYRQTLLGAVRSLLAKDVTIFPVDAYGLQPDISFDAENGEIPLGADTLSGMIFPDISDPLEIAAHSGGKAYVNTNGFLKSFAEVISFAKGTYTLGFYLSGPPDNQFHKLNISTNRSGVHLRYRPGYWDPAALPETTAEVNRQLEAALDSPFTAGEIQLQAGLKMKSSTRALITLFIDPKYLLLNRNGDRWTGEISIICGQKDPQGRVYAVPPVSLPVNLPERVKASGIWIKFRVPVALRRSSTKVRVAVEDSGSRRTGSVDVPL